jgi:hypothetical protein
MTKFSHKCSNAIEATSSISKEQVQVRDHYVITQLFFATKIVVIHSWDRLWRSTTTMPKPRYVCMSGQYILVWNGRRLAENYDPKPRMGSGGQCYYHYFYKFCAKQMEIIRKPYVCMIIFTVSTSSIFVQFFWPILWRNCF